jgi:o-succinylbenzoate synthase
VRIEKCDLWEIETASSGRPVTRYGAAEKYLGRVIIRVQDDNGLEGWGESSPLPKFTGETAASTAAALRPAMDHLRGQTLENPVAAIDELTEFSSCPAARAGLEMALLDLECKAAGRSLADRLGGERRAEIATTRPFGIVPISEAMDLGRRLFEEGIRTFKMKVGVDPESDAARIRAIREAFPEEVRIRVDANGGFTRSQAIDFAGRIQGLSLEYFEQPTAPDAEGAIETFRAIREMGVRVVVDESIFSVEDARKLIEKDAVDGGVIKIIKFGGLLVSRETIREFEKAGKFIVVVSPYECHIGKAAGLALALSMERCEYAQELGSMPFELGFSNWRYRKEGGTLIPDSGAGHGGWGIVPNLSSIAKAAA